ncbi:MAG: glycosyltransferase [Bosea sp.]|nr:glycosyltransferase [Bosea sp. (in: a-proteobacteria)]
MSRLTVLHVAPHLGQGGAERLLFELARQRCGETVHHIALMQDEVFFPRAEVKIHDLGLNLGRRWQALRRLPASRQRLRALVDELKPDLIQGWLYYGALLTLMVPRQIPRIWSIHNSTFPDLRANPLLHLVDRLLARTSRRAQAIVYCAHAARILHEQHGYAPEPGLVIENGVDTGLFRANPERRQRTRAGLGLDDLACAVLLSARNDPQKDIANCLAAFALFRQRRPQAVLLLAGRGMEAGHPELESLVAHHGLGDAVRPLGPIRDMAALIDAADAVMLGSRYGEAMPLVLLEALVMQKPVAATDVGDVAQLPCPRAALAPPANSAALADALSFAVMRDPIWEACFTQARGRYGIDAMLQAHARLYRRLVVGVGVQ